jgi:hypothetical protein
MNDRTCTTCGTTVPLDVAGMGYVRAKPYCHACFGAACRAQREDEKAQRIARHARQREDGIAFWRAKGIEPGAPVTVFGSHLMFGRMPIHGTAEVGNGGAFVRSPRFPRRPLDPTNAIAGHA